MIEFKLLQGTIAAPADPEDREDVADRGGFATELGIVLVLCRNGTPIAMKHARNEDDR